MMENRPTEAGIDWLTGTSQSEQAFEIMFDLWNNMVSELEIPRRFRDVAKWMGYDGERIEHGFIGERNGQALVRLSGPLAYNYADQFLFAGARPSRIDFQVTGYVPSPSVTIESMYRSACAFNPPSQRPPAVKAFLNRRQNFEGLYVGRRASEVFLRIYDKYEESREKMYVNHVRVELEAKAHTARSMAGTLMSGVERYEMTLALVKGACEARGLTFPFDTRGDGLVLRKTTYPTPIESKAAWLKSQVSPTIQALIEQIGEYQVMSLLFPDGLDRHIDNSVDE
jgi:hypothetical protein